MSFKNNSTFQPLEKTSCPSCNPVKILPTIGKPTSFFNHKKAQKSQKQLRRFPESVAIDNFAESKITTARKWFTLGKT
jgi:hypothetical protein